MRSRKTFTWLAFLFSFFFIHLAMGQELTYSGQVTSEDENEPLIGVNILLLRTGTGTQTDFDGIYEIQASPGDTLRLSYVGYETIDYRLGAETTVDFVMQSGSQLLEEVIVVGYGTQKQKDLTSSITTISSEEIMRTPTG